MAVAVRKTAPAKITNTNNINDNSDLDFFESNNADEQKPNKEDLKTPKKTATKLTNANERKILPTTEDSQDEQQATKKGKAQPSIFTSANISEDTEDEDSPKHQNERVKSSKNTQQTSNSNNINNDERDFQVLILGKYFIFNLQIKIKRFIRIR